MSSFDVTSNETSDETSNVVINININLLSDKVKSWVLEAYEEDVAKILELGYNMMRVTNNVVDNTNILLENKKEFDVMKDSLNQTKKYLESMMGESTGSAQLGKKGEEDAYAVLSELCDDIRDMHDRDHCGDYCVDDKILVEVKNYTCAVPTKEVEKFKRDLETTKKEAGLFWSLNTPIAKIKDTKCIMGTINGVEIPMVFIQTRSKEAIKVALEWLRLKIDISNKIMSNNTKQQIDIKMIEKKIIEIEQNVKSVVVMRNMVKKMVEQFMGSTEGIFMELTTMECNIKTNIDMIRSIL